MACIVKRSNDVPMPGRGVVGHYLLLALLLFAQLHGCSVCENTYKNLVPANLTCPTLHACNEQVVIVIKTFVITNILSDLAVLK
jgi:hypothetical protein